MFQQDFVLRQIEMMAAAMAKLIFHKEKPLYQLPEENKFTGTDFLCDDLHRMLDRGEINEAENLLYERLNPGDLRGFEVALDFYTRLNRYDNDFLESRDYSREEVREGLEHAMDLFGIQL